MWGLCGSRHYNGEWCGRAWAWLSALQLRTVEPALAQEELALPLYAVRPQKSASTGRDSVSLPVNAKGLSLFQVPFSSLGLGGPVGWTD